MSTTPDQTPTIQPEIVEETKELATIVQQNALLPDTAQSLLGSFQKHFADARSVLSKSRSIVVTDISQKLEMKMARECRLALKTIRVASDKTRKERKDESLRTSRAIDGFHNILLHLTENEERRLEEVENFEAVQEQKRKAALKEERTHILGSIKVDPALYNLEEMSVETFNQLVEGVKLQRAAEAERLRVQEAERIAQVAREAEERERIRLENERLVKEAAEREKAEKVEKARRHDLHCTRMAILGAENLLDRSEVLDADFVEQYATQSEEEFTAIRDRLRARKVETERLAAVAVETARKLKETEEAAEAERTALLKERAEAEAKAERERKAAAKKHAEERAAREKAEAELKAQREAEAKRQADEAEAARKLAAAPDKEKIVLLAKRIDCEIPDMSTAAGKDLVERFMVKQAELIAWLRKEYQKL